MVLFGGFVKQTLHDYTGKIAATVATMGCNFRCPFCLNHSLITVDRNAIVDEEEIFNYLEKASLIIDGVCITGGEPTLHPDLPDFIRRVRNLGYPVKLDTNGTNPKMLREMFSEGLIDYVAMDVKAPLSIEKYSRAAGVNLSEEMLAKIKESIELISTSGVEHEFRTTWSSELLS